MIKSKAQKGITLIALIITIVVLLILAAVAINSIQEDGILSYAENAAKEYNQSVLEEQGLINKYMNYFTNGGSEGGNGNENGSGGVIGDATVGTKATSLSTINGQEYNANNPVIPAGFKPINTETSSWDGADLAAEVKKGLVISDGTSEFVWIPVVNINEMAKVTSGKDANGRTNYEGVLYDFSVTDDGTLTATEKTSYGQSTTSYRESANLSTNYDNTTNLSTWTEKLYQETFNKMVESVIEYKGFYVGRYETSLNGSVAQSTSGAISMTNGDWFRMYENSKTYSTSNTKLGVVSEMIWGCQYDAMLRWMQSNSIDVTSVTPTDTSRGVAASYNTTRVTGSSGNDLLNNIYDILGNSFEYTQEAFATESRVVRSGMHSCSFTPRARSHISPTVPSEQSYRLALYVKL